MVEQRLAGTYPQMPAGVEDRAADVWESLLAVADVADGKWPQLARAAAVALVAQSKESTPSLGVMLLADLRKIFGDQPAMSTETILAKLCALEEAPWGDLKGKPLAARQLASLLGQYGVRSKVIRTGPSTPRGYAREDLWDAWSRYLDSQPTASGSASRSSATSATSATNGADADDNSAAAGPNVEDVAHVAATPERYADKERF
jgi:hypothetical protein